MLKTILNFLAGALVASAIATAFAATGVVPQLGFQTVDGTWLLGLASGQNYAYQSGVVAHAGGTQALCQNLTPGFAIYQVDTVATNHDSICLPFAIAGTDLNLRNNGSATLSIYGQPNNNLTTGAADTINGTAGSTIYPSGDLASQSSIECFAAKNGSWSCVHGN
jgi:hypothetical protein